MSNHSQQFHFKTYNLTLLDVLLIKNGIRKEERRGLWEARVHFRKGRGKPPASRVRSETSFLLLFFNITSLPQTHNPILRWMVWNQARICRTASRLIDWLTRAFLDGPNRRLKNEQRGSGMLAKDARHERSRHVFIGHLTLVSLFTVFTLLELELNIRQCDEGIPACSNCNKAGTACVAEPTRTGKQPETSRA